MATDLRGLNSFKSKLEKYSSLNMSLTNQLSDAIAKRGEDIAREEYSGINKVNVSHETLGSGQSRVIAEREGIAYIEFGTGRVGEQSKYPKKKLPQQGVPITGSWTYYYPSEHKITIDGEEGWFLGSSFIKGRSAGMQMYHTSQRLRNEMASIVLNKIKGDGKSV